MNTFFLLLTLIKSSLWLVASALYAGAVLPSRIYKTFVKLEVYPYKLSVKANVNIVTVAMNSYCPQHST